MLVWLCLGRLFFLKCSSDFLGGLLGSPHAGRLRYREFDKAGTLAVASHNQLEIGGDVHHCKVHRKWFI